MGGDCARAECAVLAGRRRGRLAHTQRLGAGPLPTVNDGVHFNETFIAPWTARNDTMNPAASPASPPPPPPSAGRLALTLTLAPGLTLTLAPGLTLRLTPGRGAADAGFVAPLGLHSRRRCKNPSVRTVHRLLHRLACQTRMTSKKAGRSAVQHDER